MFTASGLVFPQVQVILKQPPPNQLYIEDLWKITLNNTTNTTFTVYITGKATETNQGEILSGITKSFSLYPGIKNLGSNDLGNIDVDYKNSEIKDIIKYTGSVPAGNYNICISVFNASDNQQIGNSCIYHEVNTYSEPVLISPLDLSIVKDVLPVFNWLPPMPITAGQRITYSLIIVEMLARQTPVDALLSNPSFFEQKDIVSNSLQYPISSSKFEDNKTYAWKVRAYVNGIFVQESFNFMFLMQYTRVRNFPEYDQTMDRVIKSEDINNLSRIYRSEYEGNRMNNDHSAFLKTRINAMNKFRLSSISFASSKTSKYISSVCDIVSRPDFSNLPGFELINFQNKQRLSNIRLSGKNVFYGRNSNRIGSNSNLPDDIGRWTLNSTLSVYDVPLSLNLLLSTEQRASMQNINNFSINFDPYKLIEQIKMKTVDKIISPIFTREYDEMRLRSIDTNLSADEKNKIALRLKELNNIKTELEGIKSINDPEVAASKIEKYGGKISGFNKFLMSFRNFGIGTNYPFYTGNTLNGIPVTGINFEMNPGLFYIAVTGLRNQKANQMTNDNRVSYERKIFGTRLGIGKYEGTHFYFTYVNAWDNEDSINKDSTIITTPMGNHVLGIETKIILLKNILNLDGEIAASLLTRDVTSPGISNSPVPSFLQKLFGINMSSSADYSYSLKTMLNIDKSKTKLTAGIKMTGPGFVSLGAPNIRNDNFEYNIKFEQVLLKNQINLSVFFNRNRDNLIPWKSSTTTNTFYGINLGVRFANLPYLQFSYSPYIQENNQVADSLKVKNKTEIYSLSTGYAYNVSKLFLFTNVNFSLQESKTKWELSDYSTNNFMLNQSVSFLFPFMITAGIGLSETRISNTYNNILYYDLSASYTAFGIWNNSAGISYAKEMNQNNKAGVFINSSIPIWLLGTLDLRAEKNVYNVKAAGTNSYNEFVFKATLTSNW